MHHICSNALLQQFYEAFKQTYCLEDSLAVLHKCGKNCDRFAAEKICEYLKNKIDQYTNTGISREDFAIMMYSIHSIYHTALFVKSFMR